MDKGFIKLLLSLVKVIVSFLIVSVFSIIFVQRVTNNSVKLFGYSLYTVVTGSMIPEYNIYDMVIAKEVAPQDINIDDDIVYIGEVSDFAGKIVTHRVIEKRRFNGQYVFKTKGISNAVEDPEITEDQVMGKVIHKSILLSFLSKIVNNIYGFYFIVFVPLVAIIFLEIMETVSERRKLQK